MRFGATEAHGLGVLIQYNFLREKGAFVHDPAARKFKVDLTKIKAAVRDLARQFLIPEGDGNYEAVKAFVAGYAKVDDVTKAMIATLEDIPVKGRAIDLAARLCCALTLAGHSGITSLLPMREEVNIRGICRY